MRRRQVIVVGGSLLLSVMFLSPASEASSRVDGETFRARVHALAERVEALAPVVDHPATRVSAPWRLRYERVRRECSSLTRQVSELQPRAVSGDLTEGPASSLIERWDRLARSVSELELAIGLPQITAVESAVERLEHAWRVLEGVVRRLRAESRPLPSGRIETLEHRVELVRFELNGESVANERDVAELEREIVKLADLLEALGNGRRPEATGSITGTITGAGGTPLTAVEVDIFDAQGFFVTWAVPDASGNYAAGGLDTQAYYAVTYNWAGYVNELYDDLPCPFGCDVTGGTPIAVTDGAATTGIDFALDEGGSIAGVVTDAATSAPVEGVEVSIYDSSGNWATYGYTDASGNYQSIAGLPTGGYHARTYNYVSYLNELYDNLACALGCTVTSGTPIAVTAGATTSGIDFALDKGGAIGGTVSDVATAAPIESVQVSIFDSSGSYVTYGYTDASGNYQSYVGLPAGTYYARTYNYLDYVNELYDDLRCVIGCTVTSGTPIVVAAGATTSGVDFALAEGGALAGTVSDAATSAPIEGVNVYIYDSAGGYVAYGHTDASGNYQSSPWLPAGSYYARTYSDAGYVDELYDDLPCPFGCTVTSGTPIVVTVGATTAGIDFALAEAGAIAGTITDSTTAAPLEGVEVDIFDSSGNYATYIYPDASGDYQRTGLTAGTYFARTYNSAGYLNELYDDLPCAFECNVTSGTPIVVAAGATTAGIDFALAKGGAIAGTITDTGSAAPVQGVWVDLHDVSGASVTQGYSDPAGAYQSWTGLPAGTYFARTWNAAGYLNELYDNVSCAFGCTVTSGTPIVVTAGATTSGVDFALVLGATITGTVTDAASGLPLPVPFYLAAVDFYDSLGNYLTRRYADGTGSYAFDGVPPGTYFATSYNYAGYFNELFDDIPCPSSTGCAITSGTPIVTTAGMTTVADFALQAGGTLGGTVTTEANAAPLANTYVDIYDSTGAWVSWGYSQPDGTYASFEGLVTGSYYAIATDYFSGYRRELFRELDCSSGCDPTTGEAIDVVLGLHEPGIDFTLDFELFRDGFESGDASLWSLTVP